MSAISTGAEVWIFDQGRWVAGVACEYHEMEDYYLIRVGKGRQQRTVRRRTAEIKTVKPA